MNAPEAKSGEYDINRVYCPDCRGPAEPGSRNRVTSTHVEYRCAAGHGYFAVRELDPCAQIAESVGYSEDPGDDAGVEVGMEALIAYKDALEDAVRRLVADDGALSLEARRVIGRLAAEGGDVDDVEAERGVWDEIQAAFPCPDSYDRSKRDPYDAAHGLDS